MTLNFHVDVERGLAFVIDERGLCVLNIKMLPWRGRNLEDDLRGAVTHFIKQRSPAARLTDASCRYSGTESTLDGLIAQLADARAHGASGKAIVKAWHPDMERNEPVTGFTISDEEIILYTDEP